MNDENQSSVERAYNDHYSRQNYFGYREALYRPFIRALANRAGLRRGASVLDLGCGQGFFTWLFHASGYAATGVDLSAEGIRSATAAYPRGPAFLVGDVMRLPYQEEFDCVFVRSCSLYNVDDFARDRTVTLRFLTYLKPGGVFVFDYHTCLDLRRSRGPWRYHSIDALRQHFSEWGDAETFFSLRVETMTFGGRAFNQTTTMAAVALSRVLGVGGELLAIVKKKNPSTSSSDG